MKSLRQLPLVLAGCLLLAGATALAQDRDRLRTRDPSTHTGTEPDQTRDRIRLVLKTDGALSDAEVAALDAEALRYAKRGGDAEQLRATVREATRLGCKSACLGELLRTTNQVMERTNNNGREAHELVTVAIREEQRDREQRREQVTDKEYGDRLRQRIEQRLAERDRLRDQQRDQVRDRTRDQQRDQTRDQQRDQTRDQQRQGPGRQ